MGHVLSDMDRTVPCEVKAGWYRFNWATSFQTWIDGTYEQRFTLEREFQLGHVLSDMDSVTTFIIPSGSAKFQLGHVLSDMDRVRWCVLFIRCRNSFNWATSFQTWIDP